MRRAVLLLLLVAVPAGAAEFRSVADAAAILYDAPSLRAKKLYVVSRLTPLEVVSSVDNWVKVRDSAGDLAWVEKKALSDRRTVVVTAPLADVRQGPDVKAPLVFQAQQGVALELIEVSSGGWVKVRHADGQSGYVQASQIWGL